MKGTKQLRKIKRKMGETINIPLVCLQSKYQQKEERYKYAMIYRVE